MKKGLLCFLFLILSVSVNCSAEPAGRKLTIMVYMCGSNLESSYGSASADIQEILEAKYDSSQVTVLLMTGGTSFWHYGYDADKTGIVEFRGNRSRVVWSEDALDMGDPATLTQFLSFGAEEYPAEDYALIMWNHGGGPMEGVCWDELFSMDSLTLSEFTQALDDTAFSQKLLWIGFDACLMSSAEVASAIAPYADYMIASQETEPAKGWNYSFLNDIEKDTGGAETGRDIVDSYFRALSDSAETLTLACIDLSKVQTILTSLDSFFTPIGADLDKDSFSRLSDLRFSSTSFGKSVRGFDGNSYDLVDLADLVKNYSKNSNGSRVLSAVEEAVVYSRSSIEGASGLSVYHPFSNKEKYMDKWKEEYQDLSFSSGYEIYVEKFGSLLTGEVMADWSDLLTEDLGTDGQGNNLFSLQLTPEQQEVFGEAELLILAARDKDNGVYGTQVSAQEGQRTNRTFYSPVGVAAAKMDDRGRITAACTDRALYAADDTGTPLLGPLPYTISEDGKVFYVQAGYEDASGRENPAGNLPVIFNGILGEDGYTLEMISVQAFDPVSGTYTNRIPVHEEEYTRLNFSPELREMPEASAALPGFEKWSDKDRPGTGESLTIRLPVSWRLQFFDTQLSAAQLYASFQITDSQQNSYSSIPVPIMNPNLEDISVFPRDVEEDEYRIRTYLLRDTSPLSPGLNLVIEATNLSRWKMHLACTNILMNDRQAAVDSLDGIPIQVSNMEPGETRVDTFHIAQTQLTGLESLSSLSMTVNAYYENHFSSNNSREVYLSSENCDLTGIAPERKDPIAEAEDSGMTWQLLSFEENAYGDWTGTLYIDNPTAEGFSGSCSIAANGIMLSGDMNLEVSPCSCSYYSFAVQDEVSPLAGLSINRNTFWYLSEDHLIARYGFSSLESLTILEHTGYTINHSVTLPLTEPLNLRGYRIPEVLPETKPLVYGDVEVQIERVFLADDGVGLRLLFLNHTERDISVQIGERSLNGRIVSQNSDSLYVAAQGKTVHNTDFNGRDFLTEGEEIRDAGMLFRINDDYSSPIVHLTVNAPQDGGHYLEPESYDAVPVVLERPELVFVSPEVTEEDRYTLRVDGEFINGSQKLFDGDRLDPSQSHLRLTMNLTNLSDDACWYSFSNITFNGQRVTDETWLINEVEAGGSREISAVISMEQLRGLDEIREISCDMEYYIPGDYLNAERSRLVLETEPCLVKSLVPPQITPLAAGEDDQLLWELLLAEEDADGKLRMLLHAVNQSGEVYDHSYVEIILNDMYLCRVFIDAYVLEPGMDFILEIEEDNMLAVPVYETEVYGHTYDLGKQYYPMGDHFLERFGIHEISELRIYTDVGYISMAADQPAVVTLKDPLPLTDVPRVSEEEGFPLITGGPEMNLHSLLVGDDGVSLFIEIINEKDEPVYFCPESAQLNGINCELYGSYRNIDVPPECRTLTRVSIKTGAGNDEPQQGDVIRDISIRWLVRLKDVGEIHFETPFSLLKEAPLGAAGGVVLTGADILRNLSRTRLLMYTLPEMEAESFSRVRLIPALENEKTDVFVEGSASVFLMRENSRLVQEDDPEEEYRWLPTMERLCTVELKKDEEGVVSGDFSGLVIANSQGEPLESVEFPYEEEPEDRIAVLDMAMYRNEKDFLSVPEEGSLADSPLDYHLVAVCLLDLTGEKPQIGGGYAEAYTADWEEVTEAVVEEEAVQTAAAERQVRITKEGQVIQTVYQKYPVVSLRDLGFVRADKLPGKLFVEYEVHYQDGTEETFMEGYPYS